MLQKFMFGILLISFLFPSINIHAQQKVKLESLIPPAPNAAEIGKYGTYPVGTLTGIPEISFPLYEINSGSLQLPITLSYHASGIQVSQKSSDIGLGWSVMAGGEISRTVYSAVDEGPHGYFNYDPPSYSTLFGMNNYYTMNTYNIISSSGYDLEPDLFVYNIGGKSGKFICDRNKDFLTIPFDPIKIQKSGNTQNNLVFQITDDNGVIYQFNNRALSIIDNLEPPGPIGPRTTTSSWHLTYMISADYVDTISFVYEDNFQGDAIKQQVYSIGNDENANIVGALQTIETPVSYNELLLKQIKFKQGYIQFNRNTARLDWSGSKSLDEMVIYNTGDQVIKKLTFNHGYYYSGNYSVPEYAKYRLKLTGFIESDANLINKKEYKFDYNNTTLPPYGSYNIDYWGFYNGASNNGLIPTTTVYAAEINTVSFANGETYSNGLISPTESWVIGNANRTPSASDMKAGILSKITYPTGGYSQFEFDPHKYLSDEYITQDIIHSESTYGIDKFTKSQTSYNFSYPSDAGLSTVNSPSIYANLNINFSASNMGNSEFGETQLVTLTNVTTNTIIKTWKHEGDLTVPLSVNEPVLIFSGQNYTIKHEVYGSNTVSIHSTTSWIENTDQHPIKIGGGLRIKSIMSYTADNELAKEENYVYGDAENGLGVKLFEERNFYKNYEDVVSAYYKSPGGNTTGGGCFLDATFWQRKFMGISKYNSLNYLGSPILYSTVTKYEGNSLSNIGKTIFKYDIVADQPNLPAEFINSGNYGAINNAWNQGELREEAVYKKEGNQYIHVSENHYDYTKYNEVVENAILFKQHKQFIKLSDCWTDPTGPEPGSLKYGQGFFTIYQYPIKTGISKRTKETKIIYDQINPLKAVTNVTDYQYQNPVNRYMTEAVMTTSIGNTQKITRVKYPQDMSDAVSVAMVSKNILSPPLEEKTYKSVSGTETLLSTIQTTFKQIGSLIEKENIKASNYSLAPETRIQFNQYDANGHILEQQKAGDVKEVYLWGYNSQYPVAKILNTTSNIAKTYITQSILDAPTSDAALRSHLNNLRTIPNTLVTTYTYKPLVGITSETDPRGKTIYYEYDGLNRLILIRDQDNNIIKKLDYKFEATTQQ